MKNPRELLAMLFPVTLSIAVDKFSAEELVMMAKDAEEIEQRLLAQKQGNEALARDLAEAKALNEAQLTEINALQSGLTETSSKLESVSKDRDALKLQIEEVKPYIEYAERLKASGKELPTEDFTTSKDDYLSRLPAGHPDKLRAETLKKTGLA